MTATLKGYSLELNPTNQIVCAYASGQLCLPAYADTRWIVVGSFEIPEYVGAARLQVAGLATTGTTCKVAIFGPTKIVASEVTLTAGGLERIVSSAQTFELNSGTLYQIAVAVTGGESDELFAVIRSASLV